MPTYTNIFKSDYDKSQEDSDRLRDSYINDIAINVMASPFYAKGDGKTDDTAAIQAAFNSLNGNGVIIFPVGLSFNVTNLTFSGYQYVIGNGSTLISTAVDNTQSIIQAVNTTANCTLEIKDFNFQGKNKAIDIQHTGSGAGGLKFLAQNCRFQGLTKVSDAINLRQNDFIALRDCTFANYDTVLDIQSDYTNGERDNTQIHIENINIIQCNLGLYLQQIDKATFIGYDVATCGTGIHIDKNVKRANFDTCHIESFGATGYNYATANGYGYYISDNQQNTDITFNNCTALPISQAGAVAGFYQGRNNTLYSNVIFNNCNFAFDTNVPNYLSLKLLGMFTWNGRFNYTGSQVVLTDNVTYLSDNIINQTGIADSVSKNLLPFSRVSSPEQLSLAEGSGSLAVQVDPDGIEYEGRLLNYTSVSAYKTSVVVNLHMGWHTLLFDGYLKTSSPTLFVQLNGSPYTILLQANINTTNPTISHHAFYVSASSSFKVGFLVGANASLIASRLELHKGFVNDFTDDPSICFMSAVATVGYWSKLDVIKLTSPTTAGSAGSTYIIEKYLCTVGGSSAAFTFVPMRSLTGT